MQDVVRRLEGPGSQLIQLQVAHGQVPHLSALTKSSSELLWGQETVAIGIQGIEHILQVLQAEGQLLMEPLEASRVTG